MDFQVTCLCHETNVKTDLCSVFLNNLIRHVSYTTCLCHETNVKTDLCSVFLNNLIRHVSYTDNYSVVL